MSSKSISRSRSRLPRVRLSVPVVLCAALALGTSMAQVPLAAPASAMDVRDMLVPGAFIGPDDRLVSRNGRYALVPQKDGNLVLYAPGNRATWSSRTAGRGPVILRVQTDGNVVLVATGNRPVWSTGTQGRGREGTVLRMQDDGNLAVYAPGNRAVWSSRAASAPPAPAPRAPAPGVVPAPPPPPGPSVPTPPPPGPSVPTPRPRTLPPGLYVHSVTAVRTAQGMTYSVTPTRLGRDDKRLPGQNLGWREAVARGVPDWTRLRDQYRCHIFFAADKPTWNLDDWRPSVGLPRTIWEECNP